MTTFILPGGSAGNIEWGHQTLNQPTVAIDWKHWETGAKEPNWIEAEAQRIITKIDDQNVNLLAKSIGTAVAMTVLAEKPNAINKIILCGIPINDLRPEDFDIYRPLTVFPADKAICFQNDADPHGSYQQAVEFLGKFNPKIRIVKTDRSDHEYPFAEEFEEFLS